MAKYYYQRQQSLNDRINVIEKENKKVQIQNEGLAEDVKLLRSKINMLEQTGHKNNLIINGVAETFAERAAEHDLFQNELREDIVNSVCTLVAESYGVLINPLDIQAAFRLKSKCLGRNLY